MTILNDGYVPTLSVLIYLFMKYHLFVYIPCCATLPCGNKDYYIAINIE